MGQNLGYELLDIVSSGWMPFNRNHSRRPRCRANHLPNVTRQISICLFGTVLGASTSPGRTVSLIFLEIPMPKLDIGAGINGSVRPKPWPALAV